MKTNFEACLPVILGYEGGYSDHPSDPGGATNLGITREVLSAWRGFQVTKDDVRALTPKEAGAIYRKNYWDACRCDDLPAGLDLLVFDCAVNQGVGRAARYLQTAVGAHVDGAIGPATLARVGQRPLATTALEMAAQRMLGYGSLPGLFKTFGLGWSRRLINVFARAITMIGQLPTT